MEGLMMEMEGKEEKELFVWGDEGEEFMMVVKGEVEMSYGKSKYGVKEGDRIYYDWMVGEDVERGEGEGGEIVGVV